MDKLFIFCFPRSGSTWLANWLSQHSAVISGPETHVFVAINRMFQQSASWFDQDEEDLISILRKFLDEYFAYRRQSDQYYLVEKSPPHFYYRELIHRIYPEAKFLHIYRDGKSAVASTLEQPWNKSSLTDLCQEWCRITATILKPRTEVEEKLTLPVKYENLISEPLRESHRICDFMGIRLHKPIEPWVIPMNTTYSCLDENRWKSIIPSEQWAELIIMNNNLAHLGYDVIPGPESTSNE